jgi:hypothetical protein
MYPGGWSASVDARDWIRKGPRGCRVPAELA